MRFAFGNASGEKAADKMLKAWSPRAIASYKHTNTAGKRGYEFTLYEGPMAGYRHILPCLGTPY